MDIIRWSKSRDKNIDETDLEKTAKLSYTQKCVHMYEHWLLFSDVE